MVVVVVVAAVPGDGGRDETLDAYSYSNCEQLQQLQQQVRALG